MKISIIHPSRGRHIQAYQTWKNWVNNADNDFEYILSLDNDACDEYYRKFFYDDSLISICLHPNKSAIEAINNAAKIATGDIFVIISDDFDCPKHWDTLLLKELKGKFDFLVKTQDGLQPTLITLPIMDRTYYNRFGYIYHPDYLHMFSDQEMTAVGHMLGHVITLDLIFEHLHYTSGKTAKDVINEKNDATWAQGQTLFNNHLSFNFGVVDPVIPYSEIKWK